jgi:regulator of replication initiation timing
MAEPKSPFPPRPTLDDLLAACDVAEEGGVPSEVIRVLRDAARNQMTLSEIIATNVAVHTENTQLREELERLSHARARDARADARRPARRV